MSRDQRSWSDEELGFIEDHPAWTARRIGEELGRSKASVQGKRLQMRQGWARQVEPWSAAEDEILLEVGSDLLAPDLARALPGRTPNAINIRRAYLGIKPTSHSTEYRPQKIGARPLVAKTCTTCGLLLTAKWFRWNTQAHCWKAACRKCSSAAGQEWERANPRRTGDPTNRYVKQMQSLTVPRARRKYEPYTEADHAILADPDLDLLQKALRLERTYSSVAQQCAENGYRSHKGLGEPTDAWVIQNPNLASA